MKAQPAGAPVRVAGGVRRRSPGTIARPTRSPAITPNGAARRRSTPSGPGPLGAVPLGEGRCSFTVWAPFARRVTVEIGSQHPTGSERLEPLEPAGRGYHSAVLEGIEPGHRYRFRLETGRGELSRPDPASRSQPEGVHGPSEVVEPRRAGAAWPGRPLETCVLYEVHVGTFTPEGTFDAIIPRLDDLRELGVTALELMPVGQFPGARNWGYDGTFPYAPQNTYGGPAGLHRLVEACHARELAVVLDVVCNHLGPEGNYLADFGPYFTYRYRTPWGAAFNFDGAGSDEVRRFFIENACYWTRDFGIDGLRLDAVHAILDTSATHIVEELAQAVQGRRTVENPGAAARREAGEKGATGREREAWSKGEGGAGEAGRAMREPAEGRHILVIAESDANDPRLVREPARGGFGLDAQWNDDFHHALHALVTGETGGYYRDFGATEALAEAFRHGFVYRGQYSAHRGRRHGRPPIGIPPARFLVYAQNHDQVGNRASGDRLSTLVGFEALKAVATATLLSPFTPLLFMGEEYGETAPFPYFVSHSDPKLVESVRRGRRAEFAAHEWEGELPDPQAEETFLSARLDPSLRKAPRNRALRALHRELISLRAELRDAGLSGAERREVEVLAPGALGIVRRGSGCDALLLLNLGNQAGNLRPQRAGGGWTQRLGTADARWLGPGGEATGGDDFTLPPHSAALYLRGVPLRNAPVGDATAGESP